jgi:hypothetical protein
MVIGLLPWGLLAIALILVGLTHGVLELAVRWQRHFVENMEAFFPLALAFSTAPLLTLDADQNMIELTAKIPVTRLLHLRLLAIWGPFLLLASGVLAIMTAFFGPVPWQVGLFAGMAPAALLSGLALATASLTGRVAVGYLVAIGLSVADLILRVLGAFQAVPLLQWIDCFAYRWPVVGPPTWQVVSLGQLLMGLVLIEGCLWSAPYLYRRLL